MELVVDANVLFSAAIKDSKTAELLLRDDVAYHAPEYLFDEFGKYRAELIEKTHRDEADFAGPLADTIAHPGTVTNGQTPNQRQVDYQLPILEHYSV